MVTDDQGPMCSNIQISLPLHCYSLCLLWQHKSSPGQALMIGYLLFWVVPKNIYYMKSKISVGMIWGPSPDEQIILILCECVLLYSVSTHQRFPRRLIHLSWDLRAPPQKMLTIDSITLMGLILSHEYKDIIEVVLVLVSYLF